MRGGERDAAGVRKRERGRVASVLGLSPLFPVPGPKACMRTGDRLAPRGPASSEHLGASTNIDGGWDAYFRERDDDKKIVFTSIK